MLIAWYIMFICALDRSENYIPADNILDNLCKAIVEQVFESHNLKFNNTAADATPSIAYIGGYLEGNNQLPDENIIVGMGLEKLQALKKLGLLDLYFTVEK